MRISKNSLNHFHLSTSKNTLQHSMLAHLAMTQYRARMAVRAKTLGRVGMVWDNMGSNPAQIFFSRPCLCWWWCIQFSQLSLLSDLHQSVDHSRPLIDVQLYTNALSCFLLSLISPVSPSPGYPKPDTPGTTTGGTLGPHCRLMTNTCIFSSMFLYYKQQTVF